MKKLYIFFKFLFYTGIFLTLLAIGGGVYLYYDVAKDLPKIDSIKDYNPPVVSEVFDNKGAKIGEYWLERRFVLSPQEIPKIVEQAVISSEDAAFFEHSGIDYMGIARAMIENIKAGGVVQGGSTITQQVVKGFFLSSEKTMLRKVKEAILAKRIEDKLTKKEILYLYLNQIYLGNRAYGIEAASRNYFHKPAKELNIAEAAMLAGLAKAPSKYNPIKNFKRSKQRQIYVINQMHKEGYITETQKVHASNQPLSVYIAPTDREYNLKYAPWFVEEVRRNIIDKYSENTLYQHGLKIYTTLDMEAQKAGELALQKGLSQVHRRHGFSGPIKHLKGDEMDEYIYQIHRSIFFDNLPEGTFLPGLTREKVKNTNVKLDPQKLYEAVVTHVTSKEVHVSVGYQRGVILLPGYRWARKRSNRTRAYLDNVYVKDPRKILEPGDVIEVQLVNVDNEYKKFKKYYSDKSKVYFNLEQTPHIEGALYVMDPFNGYVKTIIGGKDFAKSEFNRATQALRQTGSVFKPLLYAAAVDKGYTPDTIIEDEPLKIPDGPGRFWEPRNYDRQFKGPMTLRDALVASRNIVSVRLVLDVGLDYVTALVRKLGVDTTFDKVYSMSLGSNGMHLSQITRAFGVFPTGGRLPKAVMIKKITDRYGNELEQHNPPQHGSFVEQIKKNQHQAQILSEGVSNIKNLRSDLWQEAQPWYKRDLLELTPFEEIILYGKYLPKGYVMSPRTAYTMVDIMQDIVRRGTGYRVRKLGRPVAGKTGTTNDQTDCWFIGYTPNLVGGVWVGHDKASTKVGAGEDGGRTAAPIFLYFMQEYLKDKPVAQFEIPNYMSYAEINPPVDVYPGDISDFFVDPESQGGADFFVDDI